MDIKFFKSVDATNLGTGHSVYKTEIFEGLTEKKEKSLRKKLRQSLEDAVKDFQNNKINWTAWTEYATAVYVDFKNIYNGKRIAEKDIKDFISAWEKSSAYPKPKKVSK